MSLCLLKIVKEWIAILFVALSSLFGSDVGSDKIEVAYNIENINIITSVESVDYKTKKIYNDKISSDTKNVLTEGEVGIIYDVEGEKVTLREPVTEVIEIGTGAKDNYNGEITGYGADCVGCSGNVSCKTPDGVHNLSDSEYYNDSQYGNLRIVAADNSLFKCGTVMDVIKSDGTSIRAIVLDTGSALRSAWRNNGKIVVDVAFKTQSDPELRNITDRSGNVKFSVKRWGW